MNFKDIYEQDKLIISFEAFPPKTEKGIDKLITEIEKLKKYQPAYVSVTHGAGGTTQGRSLKLIKKILNTCRLPVTPHFTCIGMTLDEMRAFFNIIKELKIENVLALRGDPPQDNPNYDPGKDEFKYANELVTFIKKEFDLGISVAGYPEGHIEAPSLDADIDHLKLKVDAGADAIITQLFFNNEDFLNYEKKVRAKGITVPIIPGIMPIINYKQVTKVPELCGSKIPPELLNKIETVKDDEEKIKEIGIQYALDQVKKLIAHGVKGLHFYLFNKAEAVDKILSNI